ncbi:MAG: ABC transporter permease [Cyanobacteria bacterium SIG30]|nr:ABC transporter permease [Cyanobacteria bacterium SIG30]
MLRQVHMTRGSRRQYLKQKIKSHIPKDWLTELRITYRIIAEVVKSIGRTGLINIAIITTLAAILTIFGTIFRTTLSVSSIVNEMGSVLEISAYLSPNADVNTTVKEIKKIENVVRVQYIPKEQSWEELKKELDVPDISNPLPDTLHIKVKTPEKIEEVMKNMKNISGINDMSYAKDLVQKFKVIDKISHTITFIVIIVVCILTVTVINNTIELVIQSRKEEIEIMRLMGVSNWYIKFPLILQGAIYGFLGAILAVIPINIVQNYLQKMHAYFMMPCYSYAQALTIFSVLILGVAFSASGSFISIKKHLLT